MIASWHQHASGEIRTHLGVRSQGREDGSLELSCAPGETGSDQGAARNKAGLMHILHFATASSREAKLGADVLEIIRF